MDPKLEITEITNSFDNTYARSDLTAPATLLSNSTSPNYQIYASDFDATTVFGTQYFFDISAQVGGEEIRDAGWSHIEFSEAPFSCGV